MTETNTPKESSGRASVDNPFADMQRVREEREQRWAQERQERGKERETERLAAERQKAIAFEFNEMVGRRSSS